MYSPNKVGGPTSDQAEAESISCPTGWTAMSFGGSELGADYRGCGITGCSSRYGQKTVAACEAKCEAEPTCAAFSFAPIDGDRNIVGMTVCTLYESAQSTPNQRWA